MNGISSFDFWAQLPGFLGFGSGCTLLELSLVVTKSCLSGAFDVSL